MSKIGATFLLQDLKDAHMYFLQTMEEVTDDIAHYQPQQKANPISGVYAHLVLSEDLFLHYFLLQDKPLFETEWEGKTGFSELQPTDWAEEYPKWLRRVRVHMDESLAYTREVFSRTEGFLSTLTDEDLEKEIDMSSFGMGSRKLGSIITGMITGHTWSIMGEVSVLKGIQGLKGYPF